MPLFGRGRAQTEDAAAATVVCPSCQEPAPADALVCPHCKGVLPPRAPAVETARSASAMSAPGVQATEHRTDTTPTATVLVACPQCGAEYDSAEELRRHAELAHPAR